MNIQIPPIFFEALIRVGTGALAGFLMAYAIKKVIKIITIIAGVVLILMTLLNQIGIYELKINWVYLIVHITNILSYIIEQNASIQQIFLTNLLLEGGFTTGFILGFKRG